jgi:hypothetical protein
MEKLFQKSTLRDIFIRECVKRIPEAKQFILISKESFGNIAVVLKAIINSSPSLDPQTASKRTKETRPSSSTSSGSSTPITAKMEKTSATCSKSSSTP